MENATNEKVLEFILDTIDLYQEQGGTQSHWPRNMFEVLDDHPTNSCNGLLDCFSGVMNWEFPWDKNADVAFDGSGLPLTFNDNNREFVRTYFDNFSLVEAALT